MSKRLSLALTAEVTRTIRHLALRAGRHFVRFGWSWEDLEQELILHYLRRQTRLDASRASAATFADRICRHRLHNMRAAATSNKRYLGCALTSLSQWGENEPPVASDWLTPEQLALRIDVHRALAELPPELVSVAATFAQGLSVTAAVRFLGVSRATLYRRVARLRQVLSDAGLWKYLNVPRRKHAA